MSDHAYPDGPEWECGYCKRRYPEDYEPDRCECGGPLTRVMLRFTLHGEATSEEGSP
jgi:hypothetical protein